MAGLLYFFIWSITWWRTGWNLLGSFFRRLSYYSFWSRPPRNWRHWGTRWRHSTKSVPFSNLGLFRKTLCLRSDWKSFPNLCPKSHYSTCKRTTRCQAALSRYQADRSASPTLSSWTKLDVLSSFEGSPPRLIYLSLYNYHYY